MARHPVVTAISFDMDMPALLHVADIGRQETIMDAPNPMARTHYGTLPISGCLCAGVLLLVFGFFAQSERRDVHGCRWRPLSIIFGVAFLVLAAWMLLKSRIA